jgi:hypothetical protein
MSSHVTDADTGTYCSPPQLGTVSLRRGGEERGEKGRVGNRDEKGEGREGEGRKERWE